MPTFSLPPHLVSEIEGGNVVLMLGAGASFGAVNAEGKHPPLAGDLAKLLAKKFLSAAYEQKPLGWVANYAVSEATLIPVQEYVASLVSGFSPTKAHHLLSTFRWRAIVTTNYDTLIEMAYAANKDAPQKLVPVIDDNTNFDALLRDPNVLPLLKLHGCVTQPRNPECPMILSADSFIDYETNRRRIFNWFEEMASDRTVLFVGYGLADQNITAILERLTRRVPTRLRYYLCTKGIGEIEIRYWEKKKVQAVDTTFDEVISTIDSACGHTFRGLIKPPNSSVEALRDRLVRRDMTLSAMTVSFLENDVDHVNTLSPSPIISPEAFYKGLNHYWAPIEQNLDVRRKLIGRMLEDYFIEDEEKKECRLVIVKAHAGAGKSVVLRRLAWEAARTLKRLCLFMKSGGTLTVAAVKEIAEATNEPVFLFIDDLAQRHQDVIALLQTSSTIQGRIVVIGTVQPIEWNACPPALTSLALDEDVIDLPYLHHTEIDELLMLLDRHHALGSLELLSPEDRKSRLEFQAGRQLLVALHEATHGESFEKIIEVEYDTIAPRKAQEIYLSVCLLNQFGATVRAGIISRLHGVTFEDFKADFFRPLEQVVNVVVDTTKDHSYEARHPLIAEFVVRSKLQNKEDLYREVTSCLRYLNPGFRTDRTAFNSIVRAHEILAKFPDHQMASSIYELAKTHVGEDPFLLQQMSIYEMNRTDGNLTKAEALIKRAIELRETSRQFQHTLAELYVRKALVSSQPLQRHKWLTDSRAICQAMARRDPDRPYALYTLIKIGTIQLEDALREAQPDDKLIDEIARNTEQSISDAIQRFPQNAEIRQVEARYAQVTVDNQRFVQALEHAFTNNPRNAMTALRLAETHVKRGDIPNALVILKKALDERPSETRLRFRYGMLLIESNGSPDEILFNLARSYSPGDANYEAQFWYGRQLFIADKRKESRKVFLELKNARVAPEDRFRPREPLNETFQGTVVQLHANSFKIARDSDNEWIMAGRQNVSDDLWYSININQKVTFRIAFCLSGTTAIEVATA